MDPTINVVYRRKKQWSITQEAFDMLLNWLDADRDRAGAKYEEIRQRLIKTLTRRGCNEAEELADETMDRVCRKVGEIADSYVGDPAPFFFGVANKVHHEYLRKKPDPKPLPQPDPPEVVERNYECLEGCMEKLDGSDRELILEYYTDQKRAKIERRRALAEKLGIAVNTLRMRAHRIKASLQECVGECLERSPAC